GERGTNGSPRPRSRGCRTTAPCARTGRRRTSRSATTPARGAAQLAAIALEARPPALGVEVPLVPEGALLLRRRRAWRRQSVLDVVATDGDERAHALGGQNRRDARGPASPIVSSQGARA